MDKGMLQFKKGVFPIGTGKFIEHESNIEQSALKDLLNKKDTIIIEIQRTDKYEDNYFPNDVNNIEANNFRGIFILGKDDYISTSTLQEFYSKNNKVVFRTQNSLYCFELFGN